MDSLVTFNTCLHPAPISLRRLPSTINRTGLNFLERANYLKSGSSRQLWLTRFENGSGKRSISQVVKSGEAETPVQNEAFQEEAKENKEVVSEGGAEAKKDIEKGEAVEKYWVLRSASEGEGKSQEIAPGDGIVVGAAPSVTGSAKPFVVDIPTVSGTHARIYSKDKRNFRKTVHEYFVVDLGSTNGTFLNRSKLRPQMAVKLSRGDTLKFGDERATFVLESQD